MTSRPAIDISIVLVNFNSVDDIEPCLESLQRQTFSGRTEIVVVDNRSTDGSRAILEARRDITLLGQGRNLGYAQANNLGIAASRGRVLLCLNFDCHLDAEFLSEMVKTFESDPAIGMVSGKLLSAADSTRIDSTGIDFNAMIPSERGGGEPDDGRHDEPAAIFGPSGAAGGYRRAALDAVAYRGDQMFDEQMFLYCEDVDLAWRLNLAGWRGRYCPTATAHHERGATRKQSRLRRASYQTGGLSNRYVTILKNVRFGADLRGRLGALLYQETRFLAGWCRGKPWRVLAVPSILLRTAGLLLRPSFLAKRRLAHRSGRGETLELGLGTGPHHRARERRVAAEQGSIV